VTNPALAKYRGLWPSAAKPMLRAIDAAHRAFASYSRTPSKSVSICCAALQCLRETPGRYRHRHHRRDGCAADGCRARCSHVGLAHVQTAVAVAEKFEFERAPGTTVSRQGADWVCSLITP